MLSSFDLDIYSWGGGGSQGGTSQGLRYSVDKGDIRTENSSSFCECLLGHQTISMSQGNRFIQNQR